MSPPLDGSTIASPNDHLIDWRFLLASDRLGRVAVSDTVDRTLREALHARADAVVDVGDAGGPYDLAVLHDPDHATMQVAVERTAPGGSLWIEHQSRHRRAMTVRRLRASGLAVSAWWHRPSSNNSRCLVALDDPVAAATVLRTVARRGSFRGLEPRLARWTHVDRWSRDVSLLATLPSVPPRTPEPARSVVSPDGERVAALITPRFASSRAVVGVSTSGDGRQLGRVAKVTRDPSDDGIVAHEAEILTQLCGVSPARPAAPANHRLVRHRGRTVLAEDAVLGEPLDRRAVRSDVARALAAGIAWVEDVPMVSPTRVRTDGRAEALVRDPLATIAAMQDRSTGALVDRCAAALLPVLQATLPSPFEHGDLSHPNLFIDERGELIAIDWELGEPRGLPLHDLVFFVGYLAESKHPPRNDAHLLDAHRKAMGPDGWAANAMDEHLRRIGVDPGLRPALTLACWTRHLAATSTRTVSGRAGSSRCETLWRAALTDAEATR